SNSITTTATVPANSGANFVILARQHIQLFASTVYSGGVGISNFKYDCGYLKEGKLWVKHYSTITAPGTFIQGTEVSVDASSHVTDVRNTATDVTFPTFEHMPYTGTIDVQIPNNTTVYLTDTLYNSVVIGTNATAIFTQPVVNVDKFIKMTNGATMKFAQCAKVRLNHFIDCGQNVSINPEEKYVTFFIQGNANFQKGAHVNGIFVMEDFHVYDNDDYDDSGNYGGWGSNSHTHTTCGEHNETDDNHTTCSDHNTTYSHNNKCGGGSNTSCGNHGSDDHQYNNSHDNDWQDGNDNNSNCDIRKNHHLHTNNATSSSPNIFKGMFYVGSLHSGQNTKWYKADFCGNCTPYVPVAWTCPANIVLCDGQEKFNLRSQYPATLPGITNLTNDQPTTFPIGTTMVHWTIHYSDGAYSYCTQNVTRSGPISVVINRDGLFCENSFRLRAVATGSGPFTYEWNTGETTPSIIAGANGGDYSVVVSNALGCDSSYRAVVSADPTDLMPQYTMYALNSIRLNKTTITSGSMGINSTCGTIDATYTSHCDNTSDWAKCKKIYKDNTSTIQTQNKNIANVVMPVFESNVTNPCNNVTVACNGTITLTDTAYNVITVNTNGTVIFTQEVVNIKTLNLCQGAIVKFTVACGKVRIKNAINAAKLVNINPDKKSMLFYCENNVTFQEGAHVYGIFYLAYGGKINYSFNIADYTNTRYNEFEGMVIAKDIYSGKYTTWTLNNFCQGCLVLRDQGNGPQDNIPEVGDIKLNNYPNPFTHTTSISFTLPEDDHVTLKVYDVSGKLIASLLDKIADKNQEYKVNFDGSELPAGIYFYKLTTGKEVLTGKMTLFR
ncbi:MAG: T9SS type A sorting domain-containing protein, partial [Bacteroidota bacterium]